MGHGWNRFKRIKTDFEVKICLNPFYPLHPCPIFVAVGARVSFYFLRLKIPYPSSSKITNPASKGCKAAFNSVTNASPYLSR